MRLVLVADQVGRQQPDPSRSTPIASNPINSCITDGSGLPWLPVSEREVVTRPAEAQPTSAPTAAPGPAATSRAGIAPGGTPSATRHAPTLRLQAKLSVGAADDPYEREADAVAARVVRSLRATTTEPDQAVDGSDAAGAGVERSSHRAANSGTEDVDRIGRIRRGAQPVAAPDEAKAGRPAREDLLRRGLPGGPERLVKGRLAGVFKSKGLTKQISKDDTESVHTGEYF